MLSFLYLGLRQLFEFLILLSRSADRMAEGTRASLVVPASRDDLPTADQPQRSARADGVRRAPSAISISPIASPIGEREKPYCSNSSIRAG